MAIRRATNCCAIQLGVLLAFGFAPFAHANNETLSVRKSENGDILITLSGQLSYCGSLGGFVGSPTANVSANQITVLSSTFVGECPQPPPGFVFPPPTPYTFTVNVGHLNDGEYQVSWGFTTQGFFGNVIQSFTTAFTVSAALPVSIPVLSPTASATLLVVLAALGIVALHRWPGA